MGEDRRQGPLADVRVLEFTSMYSGPMAGLMLADLGATVTKVETAEGDPMRHLQPRHKGMCAAFFAMNRHKKSIRLDLKSVEGRDIARRLALASDVLIENMRAGAMNRLGLSYEDLARENPRLIYVSITGFGDDGPYVNRPAYDQVIQALTGIMELQHPEGAPAPLRSLMVDKYSATAAASAVLAALYHRERSGEGQYISLSLMNAFSSFALIDNLHNLAFVDSENCIPVINITQPIRTADGHVMGHIQSNEQFALVARILGREDMLADERFADPWGRLSHYDVLWGELEKASIAFTTEELEARFLAEGAPMARVNTVQDFLDDPQARHGEAIVQFDDPEYGPVRVANYPAHFSGTPAEVRARAPRLGEHGDAVLAELGMTEAEIAAAHAAGAVI